MPTPWAPLKVMDDAFTASIMRNMVLITSTDSASVPGIIGSAFVVHRQANVELCITAAHVIEAAIRVALPGRKNEALTIDDLDAARLTGRLGVWLGHGNFPGRRITAFDFCKDSDVALLAFAPPERRPEDAGIWSIDSDFYPPGTRVAALGGGNLHPSLTPIDATTSNLRWDPRIKFMAGTITAIQERGVFVRRPVYTTTIPFTGGMSGGPLLALPTDGEKKVAAIGIVHSDASKTHDNPSEAGCSTAIPALFIYELRLNETTQGLLEFHELVRRGHVMDEGNNRAHISVRREADNSCVVSNSEAGLLYPK